MLIRFLPIISLIISVLLTCSPCLAMPPLDPSQFPAQPDYAAEEGWLVKPEKLTAPVDVFYVYPTVLFNDSDWAMETSSLEMRAAVRSVVERQAAVFEGQANIYVPMYRQMNLAVLGLSREDGAPLLQMVHEDIWRALKYYLKHENKGRPFFLAGHSQGSMILVNLMLKHWGTTGAEDRFIAALLPGWTLTAKNLAEHPAVVMCTSAEQTGCVISYNTMAAGKQKVSPTLMPGAVAVNPLSWTTDGAFVSAEKNLGAMFFDAEGKGTSYPQFTSAQIVDGGLIVQPAEVDIVTVKGGHFPAGVYHAFDYALFWENLKANIKQRIAAFNR